MTDPTPNPWAHQATPNDPFLDPQSPPAQQVHQPPQYEQPQYALPQYEQPQYALTQPEQPQYALAQPEQPQYAPGQYANPYPQYAMVQAAPYGIDPVSGLPFSDKSKLVAGLLQIFLGGFGIGRFYLGNVGMAIAQIAVTWLTFGLGSLWPLIDGIVILAGSPRDAAGRPLRS